MTPPTENAAPPDALPLEVRAIAVLLALEIAAGLWFAINWPPGMSVFLSQIPAFGAVGVLWGFLPKEPKDAFSVWLAARLRRTRVWTSITALLVLSLCATCFVNTVTVTGAPPDATWIYRHAGVPVRDGQAALSTPDSLRLRGGGGPLYFWTFTSPFGREVWLRSLSMLTRDERTVLPWWPTRVAYPEDFAEATVVAALPGSRALMDITSPKPLRLFLIEQSGDTLAVDTVASPGAVLFAFIKANPPKGADSVWRTEGAQMVGGLDTLLLKAWLDSSRTRYTRRPLRTGEHLRLVALDSLGTTVWTREVTLHAGTTTTIAAP